MATKPPTSMTDVPKARIMGGSPGHDDWDSPAWRDASVHRASSPATLKQDRIGYTEMVCFFNHEK